MIRCFGYLFKLTWLVLGGDPAARSHRVEQLNDDLFDLSSWFPHVFLEQDLI
jgi:hypothetical protein